jgi:hypothetical protein
VTIQAILKIEGEVTESGELRVDLPPDTPRGKVVLTLVPVDEAHSLEAEALLQPQDAGSWLDAIRGKWPGDESDEEVFAALEELS